MLPLLVFGSLSLSHAVFSVACFNPFLATQRNSRRGVQGLKSDVYYFCYTMILLFATVNLFGEFR